MTKLDFELNDLSTRQLNQQLQQADEGSEWHVSSPGGRHALAVGLTKAMQVTIDGHVGYYGAGMNQQASVTVNGNAGPGVAENMMSGRVEIVGNASQYAGASAHGGLLVIQGNASSRCGISMKGVDIVVKGSIGHMSAFMAQAGNLVVCEDAGPDLGDSIYEADLFVGGGVSSLGADCIEKEMRSEHVQTLTALLQLAAVDLDPSSFRRFGSARNLYHFNVDNASNY